MISSGVAFCAILIASCCAFVVGAGADVPCVPELAPKTDEDVDGVRGAGAGAAGATGVAATTGATVAAGVAVAVGVTAGFSGWNTIPSVFMD